MFEVRNALVNIKSKSKALLKSAPVIPLAILVVIFSLTVLGVRAYQNNHKINAKALAFTDLYSTPIAADAITKVPTKKNTDKTKEVPDDFEKPVNEDRLRLDGRMFSEGSVMCSANDPVGDELPIYKVVKSTPGDAAKASEDIKDQKTKFKSTEKSTHNDEGDSVRTYDGKKLESHNISSDTPDSPAKKASLKVHQDIKNVCQQSGREFLPEIANITIRILRTNIDAKDSWPTYLEAPATPEQVLSHHELNLSITDAANFYPKDATTVQQKQAFLIKTGLSSQVSLDTQAVTLSGALAGKMYNSLRSKGLNAINVKYNNFSYHVTATFEYPGARAASKTSANNSQVTSAASAPATLGAQFAFSGNFGPNPIIVKGCMKPTALNYKPTATVDDGTCTKSCPGYTSPQRFTPACPAPPPPKPNQVPGCTIVGALNYNPTATVDDGTCTKSCPGYTSPQPYVPACPAPPVPGCTQPTALNYNPTATVDDGTCTKSCPGYTSPQPYVPACPAPPPVPGCMNLEALNYNKQANIDDGSCIKSCPGNIPQPLTVICPPPITLPVGWSIPMLPVPVPAPSTCYIGTASDKNPNNSVNGKCTCPQNKYCPVGGTTNTPYRFVVINTADAGSPSMQNYGLIAEEMQQYFAGWLYHRGAYYSTININDIQRYDIPQTMPQLCEQPLSTPYQCEGADWYVLTPSRPNLSVFAKLSNDQNLNRSDFITGGFLPEWRINNTPEACGRGYMPGNFSLTYNELYLGCYFSNSVSKQAAVVTHEFVHNLGFPHDIPDPGNTLLGEYAICLHSMRDLFSCQLSQPDIDGIISQPVVTRGFRSLTSGSPYVCPSVSSLYFADLGPASTGDCVKNLQWRLNNQNFGKFFNDIIPINGFMDPPTISAVKAYQSRFGLPATGIVDMYTWGYVIALST